MVNSISVSYSVFDNSSRRNRFADGVFCGLFCLLFTLPVMAQDTLQTEPCLQTDLSDVIRKWRHKPPKDKAASNSSLLLVPAVSSNPATGFSFGFAGQYAFKGNAPGDLYSSINGSANYTTKNQFLFQVKNNIFLKNNRLFLSGDWRVFLFSQATYGLGTNSPEGGALDFQFNTNGWESTEFPGG